MASRSYVPRHSAVPVKPARTATRMASALATTVGATAVATTALAGPAGAAPSYTVWNRVASCESGRNWHINTGNGYYGGLQFSSGTWAAYHGHKYASQANRATRLEQIEVARRVLASQGPGAWPVCGPRAGLTRSSGHATHAALPRTAGGTSTSSHTHRKKVVRHKRVVHRSATTHKTRHSHSHTYVVRSGDTLSTIATRHHVRGGWHALYRANRAHLHNPNVIRVGQHLRLP